MTSWPRWWRPAAPARPPARFPMKRDSDHDAGLAQPRRHCHPGGLSHRTAAVQGPQQNYPASRCPALPALNTARRCACALVQVLADIAGHRAQVTCEFAQRGKTRLLREGGAGLSQDVEALVDDLPGGIAVGQDEV